MQEMFAPIHDYLREQQKELFYLLTTSIAHTSINFLRNLREQTIHLNIT